MVNSWRSIRVGERSAYKAVDHSSIPESSQFKNLKYYTKLCGRGVKGLAIAVTKITKFEVQTSPSSRRRALNKALDNVYRYLCLVELKQRQR